MSEETISAAAEAVMRTRVKFGWTFGKRPKVMAIDLMMAESALRAAQGIEAGIDETRRGSAEGESPVPKECAKPLGINGQDHG